MSCQENRLFIIGDGQMQAFMRVGNESVVASMSKHKKLVLKGSNMSYDSLVSRWRFEDMAFTVLRDYGFKKIMAAYKGHDGYTEGMDPTFSTPWDSFVLVLPKFNIDGVEGVYINSDNVTDYGGQTSGQTSGQTGGQTGGQTNMDTTIAEVLRLIKENPQITRKVLSETIGIASSAIQKHINRLKAEGVIRRVGGDYGGYWEVIK